jgi:PAS domain S-box-containing protein
MAAAAKPNSQANFLLDLYRKALTLPEKDLYNYFLDHAVALTKSTIGFFHFVSDKQQTINLTTWNNEALKNCTANYITHYPLEQAGNWADSIRLKRPIIYNNFQTSPNQKGLPKGHIPVTRLLSVPIMETNKVQAIFGVGNKPEPYTDEDALQLELVAGELNKIIKQRQAENQLRESQEKYRSLFTNMLDGFIYGKMVFDEEGNASDFVFIEVNDAFEKIIGLKKDALIGKSVKQILPQIKTTYHELLSIAGRVTRSGKEEQFELFFKPFNMWLSIAVYCPRADHFAAVFQNVTERKNAENALRENEHRWITTLSSVGDAVIATDINGKNTFMNEVAEKLTGWTLKTASKKPLKHVFHIVNELPAKKLTTPLARCWKAAKSSTWLTIRC